MPIALTPEQETIVAADAREASFDSPESYLADRLRSVHAEDQYFFDHREEFDRLIEEGILSAESEELMSPEEAKADIERMKLALMASASAA